MRRVSAEHRVDKNIFIVAQKTYLFSFIQAIGNIFVDSNLKKLVKDTETVDMSILKN